MRHQSSHRQKLENHYAHGSENKSDSKIWSRKRIGSLITGVQDTGIREVEISLGGISFSIGDLCKYAIMRYDLVPAIWQRQILQGILGYPPMTHVVSMGASHLNARQGTRY
jgi:hypothetical protein